MIVSATKGFYGSVSDKSIVKFDGAMMAMKNGLYDSNRYEIYNEQGVLHTVEGAYNLCEIMHFKWANNRDEVVWATRNGSITKYVVRSER
jgi:hypothetical protein